MKRKVSVIITMLIIMTVAIGAGTPGFFVTDNPIVNLDELAVDSPGINMGDVSIYDTDPNNDSENPMISDDQSSEQPKNSYTVRVRGKNIYFDNKLLLSVDALIEAMEDAGVKTTTSVHLVEDYADSKVYKEVKELLSEECTLIVDQWEQ